MIDGGNSLFTDTDRRALGLKEKNIGFVGMGVSGGEEGALLGPEHDAGRRRSRLCPPRADFHRNRGPRRRRALLRLHRKGSAGHYVKMVHNGIEYAIMQLISEAYDLFASVCRLDAAAMPPSSRNGTTAISIPI